MHTLSSAGSLYTQQRQAPQSRAGRCGGSSAQPRRGPRTYLDLAPVGLRFREAQSRLEGGGGGGRLAGTRDQRSGEQGTRQRQEAQQVHGGRTGSRGSRSGGRRRLEGASLSSRPRPSPAVSFGETPPNFGPRIWQPRAGVEAPGVRYEPHRKPDIRAALGGGPRGEARAPGGRLRRSRVLFWRFAKKGREGGVAAGAAAGGGGGLGGLVERSHPEMFHSVPRSPRVPRPPPPSPRPK